MIPGAELFVGYDNIARELFYLTNGLLMSEVTDDVNPVLARSLYPNFVRSVKLDEIIESNPISVTEFYRRQ